jgi:ABC-type multidrug transport system fused ATPase/permease subunit
MSLSAIGLLGLWSLLVKALGLLVGAKLTSSPSQADNSVPFVGTKWFTIISAFESAMAITPMLSFETNIGVALISAVDSLLSVATVSVPSVNRCVSRSFHLYCGSRAVIAVLCIATLLSGAEELSFSSSPAGWLPLMLICSVATRFVIAAVLCFLYAVSGVHVSSGGSTTQAADAVYSPLATRGEDSLGTWSSNENEFSFAADDPRVYSVSYTWMNDVFTVASAQTLKEVDIPILPADCCCAYNTKLLSVAWDRTDLHGKGELNSESDVNSLTILQRLWRSVNFIGQMRKHDQLQSGRLLHALLRVYWKEYMKIGLFVMAFTVSAFAGPILLSKIVESRENNSHAGIVFAYIATLFLSRVLFSVSFNYMTFLVNQIKIAMGGGIKGCIYNKILSLSTESRRDYTAGNIATIYTVDVDRVLGGFANIHSFWVLPVQIAIALVLLFFQVSYAMFAGLLTIIVVLVLNRYILKHQKKENDEILECKDRRMKFVNEYLASVLIVKLNAWEPKFTEFIQARRTEELDHIWNYLNINAALIFFFWMVSSMVSVVTLSVYVCVLKQPITASKIFTTLTLFRMLQEPLRAFPGIISQWFQAQSSLERMQKLYVMKEKPQCDLDEAATSASVNPDDVDSCSRIAVVIPASISFCWNDSSSSSAHTSKKGHESVGSNVDAAGDSSSLASALLSKWCARNKDGEQQQAHPNRGRYALLDAASSHGADSDKPKASNPAPMELEMGPTGQSKVDSMTATHSFILQATAEARDVSIRQGELVIIHGAVGTGKSSFLHASLGEMYFTSGIPGSKPVPIALTGSVALVPQQPWIQNLTIRDNILFGKSFDAEVYNRVITVCGLQADLAELPQGDDTQIGERGINLSGGQRARVSLARAVYADTDIILLDDVLAALDPAVAMFVFQECLVKYLHGKTRILVTHNPEFVADSRVHRRIAVQLSAHGSGTSNHGGGTVGYLSADNECACNLSVASSEHSCTEITTTVVVEPTKSPLSIVEASNLSPKPPSQQPGAACKATFSAVEERAEGRVKPEVYMQYLNSLGGYRFVIFLCCVQTCWQLLSVSSDLFLSHWTQQTPAQQHHHLSENLGIYSALALSAGFIVLVRTLTVSWSGFAACKWIFDQVLGSLMSAPMAWYDRNPSGRILNRLSDDQSKVDMNVPFAVGSIFANLFALLGDLITVLVATKYLILIILPMSGIYYQIMKLYLNASREIQRMTSIANSPVLSLMSESCVGVYVIRAFGVTTVQRFIARHGSLIDNHNTLQYASSATKCWFMFRIQFIGSVLLLMIALLASTSVLVELSPGLLGLCLTYGLTITTNMQTIVEHLSNLEIAMVCPERLLQYSSLPAEGTIEQKVSCCVLFCASCTFNVYVMC